MGRFVLISENARRRNLFSGTAGWLRAALNRSRPHLVTQTRHELYNRYGILFRLSVNDRFPHSHLSAFYVGVLRRIMRIVALRD
jgi:hypothetical protein